MADVDDELKAAAIRTIKRLEAPDFVDTIDGWDIYHFPGKGVGTIAIRIEEHPEQHLHIGIFSPITLSTEEIRRVLPPIPLPN